MRCLTTLFILTAFTQAIVAQERPFPSQPLPALGNNAPLSGLPAPPSLPPTIINNAPPAEGQTLTRFDPEQAIVKRVEERYQLWVGAQFLRDFGASEREAHEAVRLIRDLHFTHYATIPGARPPFEYWLSEGNAVRGGLAVKNAIPFNSRALRADNVSGAWIIRDDNLVLYNFGVRQEAAAQALAVMKKFSFNQYCVIGVPNPVMTFLTIDPRSHANQARATIDPKEILAKITEHGLILPNVGYAGSRIPIEERKLDVVRMQIRMQFEWVIVHGKDVIARFGPNLLQAREALRALRDSHVTDMCLVGASEFPIFLSNGRPPRQAGLGFNNVRLETPLMKVQTLNNVACITEGDRIIFEFGNNPADAELVLKVLQAFHFDQICPIGDPSKGGLRLFIKSK